MRTTAYTQSQALTLDGERAFEELYTRLARWTQESEQRGSRDEWSGVEATLERCVSLLGFMDRTIDLERNNEIAAAVLSLHRFAIGALVKAKAERKTAELEGLPQVFISLAEIFTAIRENKIAQTDPAVS
jgi:flagellin-specific chaperone FliS